jgi:hypothetical protein
MSLRAIMARRRRHRFVDVWPILASTRVPPPHWPGWPDGNSFAFVVTHDVEGPEGLAKVRRVAELEMSYGIRSSFNFIPEGDYRVSDELRSWLTENGFEVGVHDLHHDGKLYRSRESFAESATQINRYLREWGAAGYRSGFMLHNYAWHHDLDIQYDATAFDTDPFEPQPDGVGTIFPFWMPAPGAPIEYPATLAAAASRSASSGSGATGNGATARDPVPPANGSSAGRGYMELPYTLPQDSTLFFVLREKTPEIWHRKLAWVAEQGGMALINVHPDYLRFSDEGHSTKNYPVEHYASVLAAIRNNFAGSCWHALPRDVARHAAAALQPVAQR